MKQEYSFSDKTRISHGVDCEPETRNTMVLVNVAYRKNLFWDGRGSAIESPAYRSLWLPQILGADTNEIVKRLIAHPKYPMMFKKAFGNDAKPSAYLISKAIATFVRVLISGNSSFDRYIRGDLNALSDAQKRGVNLFFSDRTNCSKCHSGIFFTDNNFHATGASSHYFDWGKFITPQLRNVEVTAPYMHEGILPTLESVIDHYNAGGRFNSLFNKDTLIKPLGLSQQEKSDIIEFLKSLTDREFLNNPAFANPIVAEK
jgi:cytochrome c peroxidase